MEITFKYDKALVRLLRSVPDAKLISGGWSVPRDHFAKLLSIIGAHHIDLDASLRSLPPPEQLGLFPDKTPKKPTKEERHAKHAAWAAAQDAAFDRAFAQLLADNELLKQKRAERA